MAQDQFDADQTELMENEARFLYFNSSSTATSLTLLGALILLGVIFYLVYVGGLLSPASGSNYNYQLMDRTITNSTARLGQAMLVLTSMLSTFWLGSLRSRKSMRSLITMMLIAKSCSSARS